MSVYFNILSVLCIMHKWYVQQVWVITRFPFCMTLLKYSGWWISDITGEVEVTIFKFGRPSSWSYCSNSGTEYWTGRSVELKTCILGPGRSGNKCAFLFLLDFSFWPHEGRGADMGSFIHLLYNLVILKLLGNKFEFLRALMGHSLYCYALYKKLILMYGQEIPTLSSISEMFGCCSLEKLFMLVVYFICLSNLGKS